MVDIRSTAAEIRRGKKKKKKERNYRAKIYMVSLLHRATINNGVVLVKTNHLPFFVSLLLKRRHSQFSFILLEIT